MAVSDAEAAAELAKEEHELGRTPEAEGRGKEGRKEGRNEKGKQCPTIYDNARAALASVMGSWQRHHSLVPPSLSPAHPTIIFRDGAFF